MGSARCTRIRSSSHSGIILVLLKILRDRFCKKRKLLQMLAVLLGSRRKSKIGEIHVQSARSGRELSSFRRTSITERKATTFAGLANLMFKTQSSNEENGKGIGRWSLRS